MVEIQLKWEQTKEKNKSKETVSKDFLNSIKYTNIQIRGPWRRKKKKAYRKYWRDYSWKLPYTGKEKLAT